MTEIKAAIATLKAAPRKGSLHASIAPGLRTIPAGPKAIIAFVVADDAAEVLIYVVTYGGAGWSMRNIARKSQEARRLITHSEQSLQVF